MLLVRMEGRERLVVLAGIALEGTREGKTVRFLGSEPTDFLRELIVGKTIGLRKARGYRGSGNARPMHVFLEDGTDVAAEMIRRGYAHACCRGPRSRTEELESYEDQARRSGAGLWSRIAAGEEAAALPEPIILYGQPLGAWVAQQTLPELIEESRATPKYPPAALSRREESLIILDVRFEKDGKVSVLRTVRPTGDDTGFQRAAIEAVEKWRYKPATLGGRPVAVLGTIFVDFQLH